MLYLLYFVHRAWKNMKANLLANLTTVGIITVSMLIFSSFSLIALNLVSFLTVWEDKIEIVAYLQKRIPQGELDDLLRTTRRLHGIEAVRYVSSSDAMAFMQARLGSQKDLLEGISPSVLPPAFEITLEKDFRNSTKIKEVISQLRQFPQIEDIQYGQEWVDTFSVFVQVLRVIQWILGGLLLAAMTFIISHTLQLTITYRREEIEIQNLLGASPAFIQIPYYIEGVVHGLLGAGLALLILFGLFSVFFRYVSPLVREWLTGISITFLPPQTILWFLVGGMVLGIFGSFVASLRILKYSG